MILTHYTFFIIIITKIINVLFIFILVGWSGMPKRPLRYGLYIVWSLQLNKLFKKSQIYLFENHTPWNGQTLITRHFDWANKLGKEKKESGCWRPFYLQVNCFGGLDSIGKFIYFWGPKALAWAAKPVGPTLLPNCL